MFRSHRAALASLAPWIGLGLLCAASLAANSTSLSVRITSPLGRTGAAGTIRIVAQVQLAPDTALQALRFYIDGVLLKVDDDGPPYAAEWVDENPFARREILVEVQDSGGHAAQDTVVLEPLELREATEVISVLLEAAVQDRQGRFVAGLKAPHFLLSEEGVPQTLDVVSEESLPATVALLVDSSQSMARRIETVQQTAIRVLEYLRPADQIIVAPFSRDLGALTGPTNDRDTVLQAIAGIKSAGGTAIIDSVAKIAARLASAEGRRAILLVTDGYDEHSIGSFEEALVAVKAAHATVYVVGIGGVAGISLKGERLLRRLAAETGGKAFFPRHEQELAAVQAALAADVFNQYVISYTPKNQRVDGSWRRISLTATSGEYSIRTRSGYFAPAPPPIRPSFEFTVTDRERRYLDVGADDLLVLEDGVEQQVERFQEAVTPVSIVLALDTSGSMRRSTAGVIEAARNFIEALRPEDALAVVLFADQPTFSHDLTTNREHSFEAIATYQANGGTALYDALADSLLRLKRADGRRTVVVVTDGRDENNAGNGPGSQRSFDDVLRLIRETGATLFPVALGSKVDRSLLERLAEVSGAQAHFPSDVALLTDDYRRIVENLRRRYVLSYTSTNSARDGAWRNVQIRTRLANVIVTSAGGYFAPDR